MHSRAALYSTQRTWEREVNLGFVFQNAHDDVVDAMACSEDYLFTSSHTVIKVLQVHVTCKLCLASLCTTTLQSILNKALV